MKQDFKHEEFLAKVLHNLKAPAIAQIDALESFLETSSNKINEEELDFIKLTLNSCYYSLRLIDIFSLSQKISREPLQLCYEKFDFTQQLLESLEDFKILFKFYNLKLKINTEKEIYIKADKKNLRRATEILLSSSIEHCFKNSTVIINITERKGNLNFEIKTSSLYIETKILKDIFEKEKPKINIPYYNHTGDGLGLYVAKEIVNAHFGSMIAQSYEENVIILGFSIPKD